MANKQDLEERKSTMRLFLAITLVVIVLALLVFYFVFPMLASAFEPGIGLKTAAIIAFFVTLGVLVILLLAAGDGLLGEIQFALPALLGFFIIFWMMIAWIF